VLAMRLDYQPIAGREMNCFFWILKAHLGPSLHDEDPFVPGLIKPEARWRELTGRYDAFDAERFRPAHLLESFLLVASGRFRKREPYGKYFIDSAF
jgi:hypothetical protein